MLVQNTVVHARGIVAPVRPCHFGLSEQAVGHEEVEVHKIGVTRKGRGALVGGISVARRPDRQDLPPRLFGIGQEVHKVSGRLTQRTHTVGRWQREYRKDNPTCALHRSSSRSFEIDSPLTPLPPDTRPFAEPALGVAALHASRRKHFRRLPRVETGNARERKSPLVARNDGLYTYLLRRNTYKAVLKVGLIRR